MTRAGELVSTFEESSLVNDRGAHCRAFRLAHFWTFITGWQGAAMAHKHYSSVSAVGDASLRGRAMR